MHVYRAYTDPNLSDTRSNVCAPKCSDCVRGEQIAHCGQSRYLIADWKRRYKLGLCIGWHSCEIRITSLVVITQKMAPLHLFF